MAAGSVEAAKSSSGRVEPERRVHRSPFANAEFGDGKQMPGHAATHHLRHAFQAVAIVLSWPTALARFGVLGNDRLELLPQFIRDQTLHDLASLRGQEPIIPRPRLG